MAHVFVFSSKQNWLIRDNRLCLNYTISSEFGRRIQLGRNLIVCKREIVSVFMAVCLEMSHRERQTLKAWLSHQPRPGSPVCGSQSPRELPCSLNKAFSVPRSSSVWNCAWRESSHKRFLFCVDVSAGVLEKAGINRGVKDWEKGHEREGWDEKRLSLSQDVLSSRVKTVIDRALKKKNTKPVHFSSFFLYFFQGFSSLNTASSVCCFFLKIKLN